MIITYALDFDKKEIIHITEASTKKEATFICLNPQCKGKLIAKNKKIERQKVMHFSHSSGLNYSECYDQTLHKMFERVFLKTKTLVIPKLPEVIKQDIHIIYQKRSIDYKKLNIDVCFQNQKLVVFDKVIKEIENKQQQYRPDCIAILNSEEFLIEFHNTNRVSNEKRELIKLDNKNCIEIDIKGVEMSEKAIEEFLKNIPENKIRWVNYNKSELLKKISNELDIILENKSGILIYPKNQREMCPLIKKESTKINQNVVELINKNQIFKENKSNRLVCYNNKEQQYSNISVDLFDEYMVVVTKHKCVNCSFNLKELSGIVRCIYPN